MKKIINKTPLTKLLSYVHEAQTAFQTWRADSWEDYEFRDGKQWSLADYQKYKKKGVDPLTINRTFPIIQLVKGLYINNQSNIVAKGRTKMDNELGQVMSESIQYVIDVNRGHQRALEAFNDSIITGFGCLSVGFNPDPRREKVAIRSHKWYTVWWDPYSSPWMSKEDGCRYAFTAEWKDIDDLCALFPEKKLELTEQVQRLSSDSFVPDVYDEGQQVEDYKKYLSSGTWVNVERRRVRPVEMWYAQKQKGFFAIMPNGMVIDLDTVPSPQAEYQIVQQASQLVTAVVKKMRVATFVNDLLLQDVETPFIHDDYPFAPYVAYLDRFENPFGIPRQIKEQDSEVNKRRTMALGLLGGRRTKIEKGSVENINTAYDESKRLDSFIITKRGRSNGVEIQDLDGLASSQIETLMQSEREIQEVSGVTDDSVNHSTRSRSGEALRQRKETTSTSTADLFENAKYSKLLLGQKINALIQDTWHEEKVLRITDRVTGAEKFVAINERLEVDTGIQIRNDITQAAFDIVIAPAPITDTIREKNMDLIFSAINKSPEEAVGPLINLALEISDLPNKDILLQHVRRATGADPINDNLTQTEREELERQRQENEQERAEQERHMTDISTALEQDEIRAKAEKYRAEAAAELAKAESLQQQVDQQGWQIGTQAMQMARNNVKEDNDPNYKSRSEASHSANPKQKGKDKNPVKSEASA